MCTERLPIPVLILNAGAIVLISLNNQQMSKMTQERDELEIHEELLEEDDDRRSSSSSDCFPFEFSDLDDEVCSCGTSSSQGVEIRTP